MLSEIQKQKLCKMKGQIMLTFYVNVSDRYWATQIYN